MKLDYFVFQCVLNLTKEKIFNFQFSKIVFFFCQNQLEARECRRQRILFSYSRSLQALKIYKVDRRGTNYQQSMAVSYDCLPLAFAMNIIEIISDDRNMFQESRIMIIQSDAPNYGVTYDCHDNHNMFIVQAIVSCIATCMHM